jgi:hypothetical protein
MRVLQQVLPATRAQKRRAQPQHQVTDLPPWSTPLCS